jgi:hypothetical protein
MNATLRSWATTTALLAALGATSLGCSEEEKKTQVADQDAGDVGKKPVLGGKLAAAVKAAESANAAAPKSGDGPPETGVFPPGGADKAIAPGAPPKIDLMDAGKDPKVLLASAPAGEEQKVTAGIVVRLQGGAIPVDYTLSLKLDKPKDDKAKDQDKDKKEAPKSWRVLGKVTQVSIAPQIPHDLADKLGKLKGTEITYNLGESSGATDMKYTLGKDSEPALGEAVVKALVDAIAITEPPLPKDPVGTGGYWMVTDRATVFGVEVVRYRVYRVEKAEKDRATLSVDVRQYAAKDEADLGALGGGQKLNVDRFESQGKGKVVWSATGLAPALAETQIRTGLAGRAGDQKNAVLQTEITAKIEANKADKGK